MQTHSPTSPCEALVEALLRAIEERNLQAIERHVEALRRNLYPAVAGSSLQAEKLEALTGITHEIERSLRRMRRSAVGEMARIRAAAPLLQHVAIGAGLPLGPQ